MACFGSVCCSSWSCELCTRPRNAKKMTLRLSPVLKTNTVRTRFYIIQMDPPVFIAAELFMTVEAIYGSISRWMGEHMWRVCMQRDTVGS